MSIDDATPEEWNRVSKTTVSGKLYHPQDQHPDPVTKQDHYIKVLIEAIEYIKQQLGAEFEFYCAGNVMKYIHRYRYKNGVEDLKKAGVYLDWLIKEVDRA